MSMVAPPGPAVETKWTDYIQVFGIIAGLVFTGYNLLLSRKSQHVANILQLAAGYRDVWKSAFDHPEIHRVLSSNVDLTASPITNEERLFLKMLILHAFNAFFAARHQMIFPIDGLRADIQDLIALPIPHQVWLEIRPYQNKIFIEFVESPPQTSGLAKMRSLIEHTHGSVRFALGKAAQWIAFKKDTLGRRDEPISLRLFPPGSSTPPSP